MIILKFKEWLANELVGTGAVYDGSKGEFNWWGAPWTPKRIKGDPIKNWKRKKKKK